MKLVKKPAFDRFQGVTEEELFQRSLEDLVDYDLDIMFVNINPGLYAVFKGHHYAGPGNHFYRCMHLSGLTPKTLKCTEDRTLLDYRIGLVNMLNKPTTRGCQDLTADEIKLARDNLKRKVVTFRPKVVAFNGRSIYETFCGSLDRDFNYGKQPNRFPQSDSIVYVMPSSSARCPQLPKVIDKVPFFAALKKIRDHLVGRLPKLTDAEVTFPEFRVILQSNGDLNESSKLNKTGYNSMSESEEEDSDENSQASGGNKSEKEKTVVLNNLSYADLPTDLLQSFQVQRLTKKNVVLMTTAEKFRRNSVSSTSSIVTDFDNCTNDSSDGSLNNYNAITTNIKNGFSGISNESLRRSEKLASPSNGLRTPSTSTINERVMPSSAKTTDIRPSNMSQTPTGAKLNGMPTTTTQVISSNASNNSNYVIIGPNGANGSNIRVLPSQTNGTPSTGNSYLKYYLVSNNTSSPLTDALKSQQQSQQPQQTQHSQIISHQQQPQVVQQVIMQQQQQQQQQLQKPDKQEYQYRVLTPLESANYIEIEAIRADRELTFDEFFNFDCMNNADYFDPNDIKLYYGNDHPSKFTMTNEYAKRKSSNEDLQPFKRVCKLNFFNL